MVTRDELYAEQAARLGTTPARLRRLVIGARVALVAVLLVLAAAGRWGSQLVAGVGDVLFAAVVLAVVVAWVRVLRRRSR